MAADDDGESPADLGREEAHRRAASGKTAGGVGGIVDEAARRLAAELGEMEGQAGLFEAEPEPLFAGPVRHVADTFEAAKGRGRPKGARNKRSQLMADYLLAKGYRDPMENLADLANADPWKLAGELTAAVKDGTVTPLDAMKLIKDANAELLPYFHSKRPVEIDVTERRLGLLVVGELGGNAMTSDEFMSLTGEVRQVEEDQ